MLLYDSGGSGNCYKVRLLLATSGSSTSGASWTSSTARTARRSRAGSTRAPRADARPRRRQPLGESGAILWYLGDGTAYVPGDPYERAKVLQWMFFEQYSTSRTWRWRASGSRRGSRSRPRIWPSRQRVGYLALDAMEGQLAGTEYLVGERTRSPTSPSTPTARRPARAASTWARYRAIRAWLERVAMARPRRSTPDPQRPRIDERGAAQEDP